MTGIRRSLTALVIAGAAPIAGAVLAPMAAQAQPARAADMCGYPPGHCTASLNKSVYAPGQHLKFDVPKHAFNPHGKVDPVIDPPSYRHVFHLRRANAAGGIRSEIRIPRNAPKGHYTLILKGHKHGHVVKVKGHFRVS